MKKTIGIIICIVTIVLAGLTSCNGTPDTPGSTNNTTAKGTDDNYLEKLPEADYGGSTFTIFQAASAPIAMGMTFDSLQGDRINDAMYYRDQDILRKYNVKVKYAGAVQGGLGVTSTVIMKETASGDRQFDLYEISPTSITALFYGEDYFLDLYSIPAVDFSQDWWSDRSNKYFEINNKLFLTTGSISLSYFGLNYCLVYNKTFAEAYGINSMYGKDLYTLVKEGKWTYDKLISMSMLAKSDINNDGVMTPSIDQYGLKYDMGCAYAFYISMGGNFSTVRDGVPVIEMDSERSLELIEYIRKYLGAESEFAIGGYSSDKDVAEIFSQGRALFGAAQTASISSAMTNLDFDYGIVPLPKYTESQEEYYSYSNVFSSAFICVPVNTLDVEKTGLIMEALAYVSHKRVRPEFIDVSLKVRGTRDEQSKEMLSMVIDAAYFDLNVAFNFGNSRTQYEIYMHRKEAQPFVSAYESTRTVRETQLQEYINAFK